MIQRVLNIRAHFTSAISPVLFNQTNKVVQVTLNKPKGLNAIDVEMISLITKQIQLWESSGVACVILQGEGGKAFCAGGDVKSLYLAKTSPSEKNPPSILQQFFYTEYTLDYKLANMNPILVALMDGIVMGGGVGISVHSPIRIATENSLFAMPEAKLGLFTDVGGGFFLSRLQNNLGMFLGLTGYRLKGADLYHAGVADFYVNRDNLTTLKEEIRNNVKERNLEQVRQIVSKYQSKQIPQFSLKNDEVQIIKETFNDDGLMEIVKRLQISKSDFAKKQLKTLQTNCPLSTHIIFEQIKRGKQLNLKENLKMDYRLVQRFMEGTDFFEGVKTVLVDKTHVPNWQFKSLEQVPRTEVERYFTPLVNELII